MNIEVLDNCPLCGASCNTFSKEVMRSYIPVGDDRLDYSFDYCQKCGANFNRSHTPFANLYTENHNVESLMHNQTDALKPLSDTVWNFQTKSRQVDELLNICKDLNDVRYLEFGASDGTLFRMFQQKFSKTAKPLSAHLLEPTGAAVICQTMDGVEVSSKKIEDLNTASLSNHYNLIVTSHSLEHVFNPRLVLSKLHQMLADDGYLYIEIPDGERWDRSIAVPLAYYHTLNYNLPLLCWLLTDLGFTVTDARIIDQYPGIRVICQKCQTPKQPEMPPYMPAIGYSAVANWQDARDTAIERLNDAIQQGTGKYLIWCAGNHTVSLLAILEKSFPDLTLDICDRSDHVTALGPYKILRPETLTLEDYDGIIISSYAFQNAIKQDLLTKGVEADKIITLYDNTFSYVP